MTRTDSPTPYSKEPLDPTPRRAWSGAKKVAIASLSTLTLGAIATVISVLLTRPATVDKLLVGDNPVSVGLIVATSSAESSVIPEDDFKQKVLQPSKHASWDFFKVQGLGHDVPNTEFGLFLTNQAKGDVRIVGAHLTRVSLSDPSMGDYVHFVPQGGGPEDSEGIYAEVDGDREFVSMTVNDDGESKISKEKYFPRRTVLVDAEGDQGLVVRVQALRHSATFTITLDYLFHGQALQQEITNNGAPFAVTSALCGPREHTVSYLKGYDLTGPKIAQIKKMSGSSKRWQALGC